MPSPLQKMNLSKINRLNSIYMPREDIEKQLIDAIKDEESNIISLYGEGGIGKSTTLFKLKDEAKEIKSNFYTLITISGGRSQNDYLAQVASTLREEYPKFKAVCFWSIYAVLWSKQNPNVVLKKDSNIKFLDELNLIACGLGFFDGGVTALGVSFINWLWGKVPDGSYDENGLKEYLKDIVTKEPKEIEKALYLLLATDIYYYLKNHNHKKFTLIIDSYEKLWGSGIDHTNTPCKPNSWIRKLFSYLESFSLIIGSRESITWQEKSCEPLPKPKVTPIALSHFSKEEAKEFLTQAGVEKQDIVERIIANSQGLPLFLKLQAETYLKIDNPKKENFNATTKEEIFENYLSHISDSQKSIVTILAVPRELTKELAQTLIEEFKTPSDIEYIDEVLNYSIFREKNGIYKMHDLVREHIFAYKDKDYLKRIDSFLLEYFEKFFNIKLKEFKNKDREEIVRAFIEANYHCQRIKELLEYSDWFNGFVVLFDKAGFYNLPTTALEELIEKLEQNSGKEYQKELAITYNNLAWLYRLQSRYKEAEEFYLKTLKVNEDILGKEHPDTAIIYNNLAWLYRLQSRYKEAEEFFLKTLKVNEDILGKEHPDTAIIYNNLAVLCLSQGRYEEAEEFNLKALKIREEVLGKGHLDTATTYNNLGQLYLSQGRYEEAEEFNLKALKTREEVLGKGHPDTATIYNDLGQLYKLQSRYKEAEVFYLKALKVNEDILGKGHPDTATIYNNLGQLYLSQGRYEEAEESFLKTLKIREEVLGKGHSDTATTYNDLGQLYKLQSRYKEAEVFYLKALKVNEDVLGIEHPFTAVTYNNLATLYQLQGRYEEAKEFYLKALKVYEEVLGIEHPETAATYNNLAGLYFKTNRPKEAKEYMQKAVDIFSKIFPNGHPNLDIMKENLASIEFKS